MGEKEQQYYQQIWKQQKQISIFKKQETWDEQASEWESGLQLDEERRSKNDRRIKKVLSFLQQRGLPGPND